MSPQTAIRLNGLGLIAIACVLIAAFADQLLFHDLPCPLCVMQRAGFAIAGMGLALNIRFGPRPSHYAITILSALGAAAVSLRQLVLHIVPGTGSYGDPFLGMHLYTWAFLLSVAIVAGCAVMLLFDRQFTADRPAVGRLTGLSLFAVALIALLALGNGISTVLQCGLENCENDTKSYRLLR